MNKQFLILAALSLLSISTLTSADMLRCTAKDWALTSKAAQESKTPILILYTAHECAYCERLKEEVLKPMFGNRQESQLAIVREVDINTGGKMTDFDGEPIRSRHFMQRYNVFATPTLVILDHKGTPLAAPIVGYNSKAQYESLLKSALE